MRREKRAPVTGGGIPPDEFRRVMRHWASGVTIVTTRRRGGIHGMTASSFSSLSLHPPLVLVCVDRRHRTHDHVREQGSFAIHILAEGQEALSRKCSGAEGEEGHNLAGVGYRDGKTEAPVLDDCLAYFECRLAHVYEGGDHVIFVGEIVNAGATEDGRPLLYYSGDYRRLAEKVDTV